MDMRRASLSDLDVGGDLEGGDAWAHVSAWALLSGRHRRLSCIVSCSNQIQAVSALLPGLSDVLTECGYPWEIVVVDRCSEDSTPEIAQAWTQLPGFRYLRVPSSGTDGRDIEAGLLAARGDAVLIVDPAYPLAADAVRRLVLAWEGDAVVAHAPERDRDGAPSTWTASQLRHELLEGTWLLPPGCLRLGLLDRHVVDWMIAG